ncbi:lysophospholipid acyltransferase family protein [Nakamurella leprariae]|uniref:1-acyl-sn-glycerol-3-phosphate acyltransferase n=1 Tax=Nakamurella leprariae TaxID=2803911 RepID=A0A939BZF3_9ACTN|nr:lysophospholipid acyltransferase family protein [Nakamurella leprariae]MBM9468085.1 1-acyl-sn-glycerol-3-phosphate acyltransferase [Nakamurella leprariae]
MIRIGRARNPVFERGNAWIRICEFALYPLTRALGRRDYRNLERLRRSGPILVVGNHISHLDPVFDAVLVRKTGRIPHILAKSSLWRLPVVGAALRGTDQIPVERGSGAAQLDASVEALRQGKVLVIYPEGTITRDPDRWPMRPRPGVAALALTGDFPVVPIAHWGTQEVFDSYATGRKFRPLPRKRVIVAVGEPVPLDDLRTGPADARAVRDASYRIMTAVRDLLAEVRGEPAPADFFDPKRAARAARTVGEVPGPDIPVTPADGSTAGAPEPGR